MKKYSEKYIFESMPVPRAVATLAIPTMISQGLLNIPLLIVMDVFIGLYGMKWTQLVVEVIMLPVSLGMYFHTLKALRQPQDEGTGSK